MPSFGDIMAARKALDGYVYETPTIVSNALRESTGHTEIILKCENLQRTGNCCFRGMAYSVIRAKEKDLGINNFVTHSTGNSGPALACAAMQFQSTAHVVVPEGTHKIFTRSIEYYKGHYYYCKPTAESRLTKTRELLEQYSHSSDGQNNQSIYIHPYDEESVIIGHATAGVEFMLQTDCSLDCVVVPVNGGGLLSGVSIAVKAMKPHVAVFAAEADFPDNTNHFFKSGEFTKDDITASDATSTSATGAKDSATNDAVRSGNDVLSQAGRGNDSSPRTRAMSRGPRNYQACTRGLLTKLSPRNEEYVNRYVDSVIRVSQEETSYAFRYLYERCKLVVDLQAAIAVAAVMKRRPEMTRYRRIGILLPGGNVDLSDIVKYASPRL